MAVINIIGINLITDKNVSGTLSIGANNKIIDPCTIAIVEPPKFLPSTMDALDIGEIRCKLVSVFILSPEVCFSVPSSSNIVVEY